MSKQKIAGALDSVATMLMYYHLSLVEDGSPDPKREMATVLPKLISLSEAQSNYVLNNIGENPVSVMIESMQVILKSMKLDAEKNIPVKASELTILENSLKELNKILGGEISGNF